MYKARSFNFKKAVIMLIVAMIVISPLIPFRTLMAAPKENNKNSSEETVIYTKKDDYAPGKKVNIFGDNFDRGEYLIAVIRPDGSIVKGDGITPGSDTITVKKNGKFVYKYQLAEVSEDFNPEGLYIVSVFSGDEIVASTLFTDATVRW